MTLNPLHGPSQCAKNRRSKHDARCDLTKMDAERTAHHNLGSPEQVRACIEAQECPVCGRGGWRSLAIHAHLAHGISADDLREAAHLPYTTPLCSSELSDEMRLRDNTSHLPQGQGAKAERHRTSPAPRQTRRLTEEERAACAARARANFTDDQRRSASRRQREAVAREYEPKYRRAAAMYESGMRLQDAAEAVGVSCDALSRQMARWAMREPRIGHPRALRDADELRALEMLEAGASQASIARAMGVSQSAIHRMVARRKDSEASEKWYAADFKGAA